LTQRKRISRESEGKRRLPPSKRVTPDMGIFTALENLKKKKKQKGGDMRGLPRENVAQGAKLKTENLTKKTSFKHRQSLNGWTQTHPTGCRPQKERCPLCV